MRSKRGFALIVSLGVLLAIGAVGWQMNFAARKTAESIHRQDTAELVRNNATLANQYLLLSAKELLDYAEAHTFTMDEGDRADRELLREFQTKAVFFPYGVALADASGRLLTSESQDRALPPVTDPGYARMRQGPAAGQPGFSSVMIVSGVPVAAVAVPVVEGAALRGLLIGFTEIRKSQLQAYLSRLGGDGEIGAIVDGAGVFAASSKPELLGTPVAPEVREAIATATPLTPVAVEFTDKGERTLAFVTTGMQGGWVSYKSRTLSVFYGPIRTSSLRSALALLGVILVGAALLAAMNHRAESVRRRSEERFRALVQNAMDVITVLGPDGRVIYDSPSVTSMLGFAIGARLGALGADVLHPDDQEHARQVFARTLETPGAIQRLQCRVRRADDTYLWADLSVTNLLDNPAVGGIVVNARDISESRRLQEQMSHQALHDALTGLPNRRLFNDRLLPCLRGEDSRPRMVGLIFIDLDRFKPVNDQFGHDAGDELLRQVSARFLTCVRPVDTLARVGGDEFVLLIAELSDPSEATYVADRILATLNEPFHLFGQRAWIGASLGVTLAHTGENPDEVLARADAAMYEAKQAGGVRYEFRTWATNRLLTTTLRPAPGRHRKLEPAASEQERVEIAWQPAS